MTLGVAELSGKSTVATHMARSGQTGEAYTQYLACVMAACRELLQARGLALAFSSGPEARARIAAEAAQVADLARYCLDQASSILRTELSPTSTSSIATPTATPPPPPTTPTPTIVSVLPIPVAVPAKPPSPPQQCPPLLGRTRSGKLPITGMAPQDLTSSAMPSIAEAPVGQPPILVPGLELVPGVEVDRRHADALRRLDAATLARASEPARELQALNRYLLKKHTEGLAKIHASAQQQDKKQQFISDTNLAWLRQQTENTAIARMKQQRILRELLELATPQPQQQQQHEESPSLLSRFKQLQDTASKHFRTQAQKDFDQVLADGGDIAAVASNVRRMLTTPTHSVAKRFQEFAAGFMASPPAELSNALDAIKAFCSRMTSDISAQLRLNPDGPGSAAAFEVVLDITVTQLFDALFELFRATELDKDVRTNSRIAALAPIITPAAVGVKRPFWLVQNGVSNPGEASAASYQQAIQLVQSIPTIKSAVGKVHALVEAVSAVTSCVDKFNEGGSGQKMIVGAEDLVPIFTFVLIKSRLRNTHAECALMSEFISEQMSLDSEGYSLATLMTCIDFVDTITITDLGIPPSP